MHPRERVTLIPLPEDSDGQVGQLMANLQARSSLYDVMGLDVVSTAEFAANEWIVPLKQTLFPLGKFLPPAVATAKYAGTLFAVPFDSNAGLLYYRTDILAAAHESPPTTWAQLEEMASTLAPKYRIYGYAGQLASYEGLTVNFDEAVQSLGGSILSPDATRVTLDSSPTAARAATAALQFLQTGLKVGWIPRAALKWQEAGSASAFLSGKLLFMRNWPYVYGLAQTESRRQGNDVAGKVGVTALPGLHGPGTAVLGGTNLAISAYSLHQRTALAFIQFMTGWASQHQILVQGSQPPVLTSLYTNRKLDERFPYLRTLEQAILHAKSRPQTPDYSQLTLTISGAIHLALETGAPAGQTIANLAKQLRQFVSR